MSQEELEEKLRKVGIKGEWVNHDEYGFSRLFRFELDGQTIEIEWFCNYSTLIIGNVRAWFDTICLTSHYPYAGKWIGFSFRNQDPVHLKVGE